MSVTTNRPKVEIRSTGKGGSWPGSKETVAWCSTVVENVDTGKIASCAFVYVTDIKVDAEDTAKRHRQWHRDHPGQEWRGGDLRG